MYIGFNNLPFTYSTTGHFCQFIGLPESDDYNQTQDDQRESFRNAVQEIVGLNYEKTYNNLYYSVNAINRIKNKNQLEKCNFEDGKVIFYEEDDIEIEVESFNPNLGKLGHPDLFQRLLRITTSEPDEINIIPNELTISKYGRAKINVKIPRKGGVEGTIYIYPKETKYRLAEIKIPFKVKLRKNTL
jgi:hypothetical protein